MNNMGKVELPKKKKKKIQTSDLLSLGVFGLIIVLLGIGIFIVSNMIIIDVSGVFNWWEISDSDSSNSNFSLFEFSAASFNIIVVL